MIYWDTVGNRILRHNQTVLTSLLIINKMGNLILKDQLNKRLKNITLKDNIPHGLKITNLRKISKIHLLVCMAVQLTNILIEMM